MNTRISRKRQPSAGCSAVTVFTCVVSLAVGFLLSSFTQIYFNNNDVPTLKGTTIYNPMLDTIDTSVDTLISHNFPPALTIIAPPHGGQGRRLMYMAAVFGRDQLLFLQKSLDCMLDICNSGWNVSVFLQVANGMNYNDPRLIEFQQRMYCAASNSYIPIHIQDFTSVARIGFGLNRKHREQVAKHINDFDYFIFGEEDMLVTVSHLHAFLNEENRLKDAMPNSWIHFSPGFLRYEDRKNNSERVTWEYREEKVHVVDLGPKLGKYIMTNNQNQAVYIISRPQMQNLEERCGFLSDTGANNFYVSLKHAMEKDWKYLAVGVSEWSSSFQQVLQCGIKRVIPLNRLFNHMMHHSANKAQVRRPKSELLTMRDWSTLVAEKLRQPSITLKQMDDIVFEQYNMHLIDKTTLSTSKWAWNITIDVAANVPS